ncbi:DUF805 domain-containing protein [Gallaecimonas xiamenensis]|uniref:DUF805 domain-containing protein n=1 Tax=Gallaecimonas xiamenensis 3-C-1 TaxID=745411 RepID=K2JGU2_9GAMM|nr:DUF805 domain-containing protein [Gallaecimonas xiamenensis]EKE69869.1 hypothetical protein B3C1_14315 [Gallaecimonas xiamenensis 3-C-1]
MDNYLAVLKQYANFNGRARRQEYWMFFLFNMIVAFVLGFVFGLIGLPFLGMIYCVAVLVPSIAVATRRLHDTGRSGWWQLISLVPLVGVFILIYFLVQDSQEGSNAYGPNPKGIDAAPAAA